MIAKTLCFSIAPRQVAAGLLVLANCTLATDAFALHIDYGRWVDGGKADVLAVHAALLPTGNILFWGGSQNDPKRRLGLDNYRLYNTDTGHITKVSGPSIDHFCSGHSVGGNGGLVVAGGTEFYGNDDDTWVDDPNNPNPHKAIGHFTGRSEVWFYDAFTAAWNLNATLMNQGRWYPSLIGVNDYYDMIALSGHPGATDTPHLNTDVSFSFNGWGGSIGKYIDDSVFHYPRGHLLSDRTVFMSGRGGENKNNMRLRVQWWDSKFEQWEAGKAAGEPIYNGLGSTSVLMPYRWVRQLTLFGYKYRYTAPQVMLVNGVQPMIKNLGSGSNLEWQPTRRNADPKGKIPKRTHGYATLLPTGDIFANGGVADPEQDERLWSEVYRVDKGEWHVAARPNKARNYHSVSLLMPDGRVWTAGSNKQAKQSFQGCSDKDASKCKDYRELQIELFEPWYYKHPARPAITFPPNNIGQGDTFSVKTSAGQAVVKAALVRPGSVTHAFDFDQRYVELRVVKHHDGWVDLKMPGNGFMTPAGYYMLFVSVNAGHPAGLIPSEGKIIYVREPA